MFRFENSNRIPSPVFSGPRNDFRQGRRVPGKSAGFADRTEPARRSCRAGGHHSGSRNGRFRAVQPLGAGVRRANRGRSAESRPAGRRECGSNSGSSRFAGARTGTNPRTVCRHCADYSERRRWNQGCWNQGRPSQERSGRSVRPIRPGGRSPRHPDGHGDAAGRNREPGLAGFRTSGAAAGCALGSNGTGPRTARRTAQFEPRYPRACAG